MRCREVVDGVKGGGEAVDILVLRQAVGVSAAEVAQQLVVEDHAGSKLRQDLLHRLRINVRRPFAHQADDFKRPTAKTGFRWQLQSGIAVLVHLAQESCGSMCGSWAQVFHAAPLSVSGVTSRTGGLFTRSLSVRAQLSMPRSRLAFL